MENISMKRIGQAVVATILLFTASLFSTLQAEEQPLGDKVESLKEQVVKLNRDLFILEEDLLFPATTQVTVYLSVDTGKFFKLDSVELKIDDDRVAGYLYTERQVNALHRGGIQRLYIGNLKAGKHEVTAFFTGFGPDGREYRRGATLAFDKGTDAKVLELQVRDETDTYQPDFKVVEWQ
ncbi:AraC family transcriptional regulator [Corallincola holothuriorum]|nr:AraC family transcriptional regulator [Corallincola holothuriorum]